MGRVHALAACVAAAGFLQFASPAAAALIGFYNFETSLTADSSGSGNNATSAGSSVALSAVGEGLGGGRAARFSGTADAANMIRLPININPAVIGDMTMGAWVKADPDINIGALPKVLSHDNGGYDRTVGLDTRTGVLLNFGAQPGYSAFGGTTTGVVNTGLTPAGWVFLAVRYAGGVVTVDVNGTRISGTDTTGPGLSYLAIGNNPSFLGEAWKGLIDNVFIYDTALSDTELDNLRVAPVPLPAPIALLIGGLGALGFVARRRV